MKTCTKCLLPKEDNEFNWRSKSKGIRQWYCRACQNKSSSNHYKNNSLSYKGRSIVRRNKLRDNFTQWMKDKSCVDCGEPDPIVLECDHVRGTKKFGISKMFRVCSSWEVILEELSKCEVRCANCHRRRTAKQFSWKK